MIQGGIYCVGPELNQNNKRKIGTNTKVMRLLAGFAAVFLMSVSTASSAVETRFMQGLGDTMGTKIRPEKSIRRFTCWMGERCFRCCLPITGI
jgi:hypothetical protein